MGGAAIDGAALAARVIAGHVPSASRALRALEDEVPGSDELLRVLYPKTGRAHVVGLTGPPGAGKSTLASALVSGWRAQDRRVGVLAVDPSSPFSGGALLGDRLRMQEHTTDPGVFIRSMATRGALGGLCRAAADASAALDAMGCDVVLVETVGVGQDELDVATLAHTTVVVCLPGTGDEVQALKAGILEAADLLVLNKADLDGADAAERHLQEMLHLDEDGDGWQRSLHRSVGTSSQGVPELAEAIDAHGRWLDESGERRRAERRRALRSLTDRIRHRAAAKLERALAGSAAAIVDDVAARRLDPATAAEKLWESMDRSNEEGSEP